MMSKSIGVITLFFILEAHAQTNLPKGKIESPYSACKDVLLVDEESYQKYKDQWDKTARECQQKLIPTVPVGFWDFANQFNDHAQYVKFAQEIAGRVKENVIRNEAYLTCTALCFEGKTSCDEKRPDKKITNCAERKRSIIENMKVGARKARIELALSRNSSGMFAVNPNNVLTLDDNQLINTNLLDYEVVTDLDAVPDPVSGGPLTEREIAEARRRLELDKKKFQDETKGKNLSAPTLKMARYKKIEEHQRKYRETIYEHYPLLAAIEPAKIKDGEASWTDKQYADAARELAENAKNSLKTVTRSIKDARLEYSRINGEALDNWLMSINPWNPDQNDLLYYQRMDKVVEAHLKERPELCGVATSLYQRLSSKTQQNAAAGIGATFVGIGMKVAGTLLQGTEKAAKAIGFVSSTSGVMSNVLGAGLILDAYQGYETAIADTSLGLRKSKDIDEARTKLQLTVVATTIGAVGSIGRKAPQGAPAMTYTRTKKVGVLVGGTHANHHALSEITPQWIDDQLAHALNTKALTVKEAAALKEKASRELLTTAAHDIKEISPQYFNDKKNVEYFLRAMSVATRKQVDDPSDLPVKIKSLMNDFNKDAVAGSWNPKAREGFLTVLRNSVDELREAYKNNPATYAKFTTDNTAKREIFRKALKRSGVKSEGQLDEMVQCALPRR